MANHFRTRPRMVVAVLIGIVTGSSLPGHYDLVTRALLGWNAGVWLYLVLIAHSMFRADHARLRKAALAHAEGAILVSVAVVAAALASLAAIALELAAAKAASATGTQQAVPHVALTFATVIGSWILIPTLFMLNYATLYYSSERGIGLRFPPDADKEPRPTYADFAYFSFTIAVALQTADVVVTTTRMRQLVLAQSVLGFVFNTTILALLVNSAAGLF